LFLPLLVAASLSAVLAHCPNGCSGHGKCGANDICQCHQNWEGADCSLRTCPFEFAWVDTALRADDAHYYAECANKGVCDRKTGVCKCFDGYEGKGCQRSTCPDSCSGHGTCEYINELANDSEDRRVKGVNGLVYSETQWDWQKIRGCKCDLGFEGPSCASRVCAAGDDPLTSINKNWHEKQRISIGVPSFNKLNGVTLSDNGNKATVGALTSHTYVTTANLPGLTAPKNDYWKYSENDLIHIGSSSKLFSVVSVTNSGVQLNVDQEVGMAAGEKTVYRVRSLIAVKADTTSAATTVDKKLTLSADVADVNAKVVPGTVIEVEGSTQTFVVQAKAGNVVTLDKNVQVVSNGLAEAKIYSRVYSRPEAGDQWFVTYYDPYGGMWNTTAQTVSEVVTDDAAELQAALRSLPNHVLDDVVVTGYHADGPTGPTTAGFHEDGSSKQHIKEAFEFIVTFQGTVGTSGFQNLFEVEGRPTNANGVAGSFPKSSGLFKGKAKNVHGTSLTLVTKEGVSGKTSLDRSELAACSNRGLCDGATGLCKCFQGFRGLACEFQ